MERGQASRNGRALADQRGRDGHHAGRVELLERVGERARRRAVAAARVAEQDEDSRRAPRRCRLEWRGGGGRGRGGFGVFRRPAARRAVERLLFVGGRVERKTTPRSGTARPTTVR